MYVRPPDPQRTKLPENYRGNAFGASGEYTDMPPPTRLPHPSYDLPPEERSTPLPQREIDVEKSDKAHIDARVDDERLKAPVASIGLSTSALREGEHKTSLLSSLIPPASSSSRFPFGHGLGTEELLILGMMLLVFMHGTDSGEVDNELIILLALLLFSG